MPPQNSAPKKTTEAPATKTDVARRMAIRPLKTYRGDVEEVIQRQKESLAKIALAEQQKKAAEQGKKPAVGSPMQKRTIIVALAVVVIIAVAGGIAFSLRYMHFSFALFKKDASTVAQKTITVPALVPPHFEREIDISTHISKESIVSIASDEAGQARDAGSVLNIFFTRPSAQPLPDVSVGKETVPAGTFLKTYFTSVPDSLSRFVNDPFMLGIYYDATKKGHVFLIFTTDSFETAFAAMLSWEKILPQDMGPLIGSQGGIGDFKDVVIRNKDTRALLDRTGEPVFIYSFIDRKTMLITEDKDTFGNILDLLNQPKRVIQ